MMQLDENEMAQIQRTSDFCFFNASWIIAAIKYIIFKL